MKKFYLWALSFLISGFLLNAQTLPQISSENESNEIWYVIQFLHGDGVVQDMGNDMKLMTKPLTLTDNQLWKITPVQGQVEKYYIVSKTGRRMAWDNGRYTASATKAEILSLEEYENNLEIVREESDRNMNQVGDEGYELEIGEWGKNQKGNRLNFILPEDLIKDILPVFSDNSTEQWYYMLNLRSGKVLQDNSSNTVTLNGAAQNNDDQLWKITGTYDNFTITNKNGKKAYFVQKDGSGQAIERLRTSNYESNSFKFLPFTTINSIWGDEMPLQIYNNEITGIDVTHRYLSQTGDEIRQHVYNNEGNAFVFKTADEIFEAPDMPEIGEWYYLQFQNSGVVLEEIGEGRNVRTNNPVSNKDGQLWKLVGTDDAYTIESKNGYILSYNNDKGVFEASRESDFKFKLVPSSNVVYQKSWEIVAPTVSETQSLAQLYGSGLDRNISVLTFPDHASALKFVAPTEMSYTQPDFPIISNRTLEVWYHIQLFYAEEQGNRVVTYQGEDANLAQEPATINNPDQLWKLTSDIWGSYAIVNKNGSKITISNKESENGGQRRYQASKTGDYVVFNFNITTASPFYWTLKREDAFGTYQWMNSLARDGVPSELCEWSRNDPGSALKFVYQSSEDVSSVMTAKAQNTDVRMQGKSLHIVGDNIQCVSIYNLMGELVIGKSPQTEFNLQHTGFYIVLLEYQNGQSDTVKVLAQ